jgi:hypothetical protein
MNMMNRNFALLAFLAFLPISYVYSQSETSELIQIENQDDVATSDDLVNDEEVENALAEAHKFLEVLVAQLNNQYGMNLTVNDAFDITRAHLRNLDLPEKTKEFVLSSIDLVESAQSEAPERQREIIGRRSDIKHVNK